MISGSLGLPFKSEKQRKYLFAKEPAIAKKWTKKYGSKIKPKKRKKKLTSAKTARDPNSRINKSLRKWDC